MTIRAAGMLLTTKDSGRALFLKRSPTLDHPGEWCLPGGGIEAGETAEEAAEREVREEIGTAPHSNPVLWTRRVAIDMIGEEVDFTTFRAIVVDEFIPKLNGEHTAWAWASVTEPPEPLHPGVRVALDRLTMDELGVARAMAAGDLTSPQKYGNIWLFEARISGSGLAYREGLEEYVWRDEALYTNPDFLARCNGLPVVYNHPEKKPSLDSAEFNKRIIGTVFLPFIKGDECWSIIKVWDAPSAKLMATEQMSTSPGVVFFKEGNTNETMTFADGSTLLIEGKPHLLDHLAICSQGVWDKAGPPTGVTSSLVKDFLEMTTAEEQAAADKARNDAAIMLTKIHDSLTTLTGRMDSMEAARKDAEEKAEKERNDKARHDAARKDKFGRKDGESYKDWTQRCDADEMAMMDELMKGGCEPDAAKKDAATARADATEEIKRMDAESFEKWANEEEKEKDHKADAARKDAEEKAEKERMDASRKDATTAENAELRTRLATMEASIKAMTAETPASELDAIAVAYNRADSVAAMFGDRAPPHIPGEKPVDYRRRLINRFKAHSRLKDSRFDSLDSATLAPLEDVVYADAVEAARAPAKAAVGRLVPFERKDRAGRTITEYHGDIKAFLAPFTRNAIRGKFTNPNGRL